MQREKCVQISKMESTTHSYPQLPRGALFTRVSIYSDVASVASIHKGDWCCGNIVRKEEDRIEKMSTLTQTHNQKPDRRQERILECGERSFVVATMKYHRHYQIVFKQQTVVQLRELFIRFYMYNHDFIMI